MEVEASWISMVVLIFITMCSLVTSSELRQDFYARSCPNAERIVWSVVSEAVDSRPRVAASLLRLHFHDCFVKGCDASILLDDSSTLEGEKNASPNQNSARSYDVVDEIKYALELECQKTVSCADILAIAARDAVVLTGGQGWNVQLGRRDSLTASRSAATQDIPSPNNTLSELIDAFAKKGLSAYDLVALSGAHTIGNSRCVSFSQRLYTPNPPYIDRQLMSQLMQICPQSGDGNVTTALDFSTSQRFDNQYYKNLQSNKGLLNSDQVLVSGPTSERVNLYALDETRFLQDFGAAMVKMGNIGPLTDDQGEIRLHCRRPNVQ